ncbi:hypothetical protein EVAR_92693_1 [Eumeta japonica]|uniref:Uncharacterized protein n=1 Tax=Eumeta variegata TaxID=151549 RepID=A0A4C1SXS4_EUMVA|nr:hypothetical protein EVAR_92693_1 [Eumeta japonica]
MRRQRVESAGRRGDADAGRGRRLRMGRESTPSAPARRRADTAVQMWSGSGSPVDTLLGYGARAQRDTHTAHRTPHTAECGRKRLELHHDRVIDHVAALSLYSRVCDVAG